MAVLTPKPVSTARFTYVPGDRLFVAEASDFAGGPFGRVYDDACDEGLTLVSARTGRQVVFAVTHIEVDRREGELLYWDLEPAPGQARLAGDPGTITEYAGGRLAVRTDDLSGVRVRVYND